MSDVQLYSDVDCTQKLDVTDSMVSVSGVTSHGGGEKGLAVDDSTSTSWRPQCHPCSEGEAWLSVTFATPTEVQCGKAVGLGVGSGGGQSWSSGINLEGSSDDSMWEVVGAAVSNSDTSVCMPAEVLGL